jgi:hypothetical protein
MRRRTATRTGAAKPTRVNRCQRSGRRSARRRASDACRPRSWEHSSGRTRRHLHALHLLEGAGGPVGPERSTGPDVRGAARLSSLRQRRQRGSSQVCSLGVARRGYRFGSGVNASVGIPCGSDRSERGPFCGVGAWCSRACSLAMSLRRLLSPTRRVLFNVRISPQELTHWHCSM